MRCARAAMESLLIVNHFLQVWALRPARLRPDRRMHAGCTPQSVPVAWRSSVISRAFQLTIGTR